MTDRTNLQRNTNTSESALTVWRQRGAICAVRVKYGDHGVRLPRVEGREGSAAGGLRRLDVRRVHCDAKALLARPYDGSNPTAGWTPRRRAVVAGFAALLLSSNSYEGDLYV